MTPPFEMYHVEQINNLDHADPNLPQGDVVQGLYTVVRIQPRTRVLDGAGYTAPTRQHELLL